MFDRMPADKLAKVKSSVGMANELNQLATTSLPGSEATRAERNRAAAELEQRVGKRQAKRLQEDALQRAGAKKRGWFG